MIIFPAIDIRDGKCVRLYRGDFSTSHVVSDSPVKTAEEFKRQGAEYLHIVDLDGALSGNSSNIDMISRIIKEVKIPVQLGGGIRSIEFLGRLFDIGLSRAVIGTAALSNTCLVKEALEKFGDRIAVGIDALDGHVAVEGWVRLSNIDYLDFAKQMEEMGVKTIIFTDINRDGMLSGPNLEALYALKNHICCDIIASGGIRDIEDINALKCMGIYGAIVGKAIYSGKLSLSEAIRKGSARDAD